MVGIPCSSCPIVFTVTFLFLNLPMRIVSPTFTSNLIIYLLFRQLLDYQNLKGLIIVPTTSLVEQLYSDFADYSSHNNFVVEETVHRVYQGKDKATDKKLTISTWQSLYKMPPEFFHQ